MKVLKLTAFAFVIACLFFSNIEAKETAYKRTAAAKYAEENCGSPDPYAENGYNFPDYKCWNGDLEECENYGSGRHVDCANFASQALIDGFGGKDANPFSCVNNADTIGKDGRTKGEISVAQLKSALTNSFCFERITDTSKAKAGDILSFETIERPRGCGACCGYSHVAVYAGDNNFFSI